MTSISSQYFTPFSHNNALKVQCHNMLWIMVALIKYWWGHGPTSPAAHYGLVKLFSQCFEGHLIWASVCRHNRQLDKWVDKWPSNNGLRNTVGTFSKCVRNCCLFHLLVMNLYIAIMYTYIHTYTTTTCISGCIANTFSAPAKVDSGCGYHKWAYILCQHYGSQKLCLLPRQQQS